MKIVWSPLSLERVEEITEYIADDSPPLSLERVEEITEYIADDSPTAALNWAEGLFAVVERLIDFPESGRVVPEVGSRRIREVIYGNYRVIYSIKERVDILTVRRSNQLLSVDELDDTKT